MRQNPLPSRSRPSFRIHGAREGPGSWPRWAPAAKENTQTGNQHFHSLLWPASHFFPCLKHQGSPGPRYPDGAPGASAQALPSARKASYPLTARPGTHPAAAAVPRLAHVLGHLVTLVEAHGHGVAQSHGCLLFYNGCRGGRACDERNSGISTSSRAERAREARMARAPPGGLEVSMRAL